MADLDIGNSIGVVDKRAGRGTVVDPISNFANYDDITSLKARLTTLNASFYTATVLGKMTKNDMIYAVRVADDSAGI